MLIIKSKKNCLKLTIGEIENKIITDHSHDQYITTQEFNKLTAENFTARLDDIANLVEKTDFNDKLKDLNKIVTSNKTKYVLVENELNELSKKVKAISTKALTKDFIYGHKILSSTKYFSSGIYQNYLVFIPTKKCIKHFNGTTRINSWKSNGMPKKYIENVTKSDSNFAPTFVCHHLLPNINFDRHCLINNNISIPYKLINLCISYIRNQWPGDLNIDFTLVNCLFGSVESTKNTDPDKYKYSGYGIEFDSRSQFSFTDGSVGKMSLFLELISARLCIVIIKIKIS